MKRAVKRSIALLLTMTMAFGTVPASAAGGGEVSITGGSALDFIKKLTSLVKIIEPEQAYTDAIDWGADVLAYILGYDGTSMSAEERAYFNLILNQIQELLNAVAGLQESYTLENLATLVNDFTHGMDLHTPWNIYEALDEADKSSATPAEKEQAHLRILTAGIGIDDAHWESIENVFDLYAEHMATAMLEPYQVVIDGKGYSMLLMDVLSQYMRRKYHWEHQGIEEWQAFQVRLVTLMVETLTLEKYSLLARIKLIGEYNAAHPHDPQKTDLTVKSRLKDVQKWLNKVHDTYGKNDSWIVRKKAGENERYYWFPGHEILFGAKVTSQSLPRERAKHLNVEVVGGIKESRYPTYHPVWAFWKPFFRPVQLITDSQLKMIFEDYQGSKTLYDIFISEDEGNFQGLQGDPAADWKMIIDPNNHNLECHYHWCGPKKYDSWTVEAYFVNAKAKTSFPGAKKDVIATYYQSENDIFSGTNFIGLQVKSVGGSEVQEGGVNLSMYAESPDGWTAEDGDLLIALVEEQGTAQSVSVDGTLLAPEQYAITEEGATISVPYLSGLSKGIHTFTVQASNGIMTFILNIGTYSAVSLPESLTCVEDNAFAGIAAEWLTFHESCREIGKGAFADCPTLVYAVIPDTVETIGEGAFLNCPVTFCCSSTSAAAAYADANGIPHHE